MTERYLIPIHFNIPEINCYATQVISGLFVQLVLDPMGIGTRAAHQPTFKVVGGSETAAVASGGQ